MNRELDEEKKLDLDREQQGDPVRELEPWQTAVPVKGIDTGGDIVHEKGNCRQREEDGTSVRELDHVRELYQLHEL